MKCQRYRLFTITIIFHRLEACADIDVKFINLSDFDMTRSAISIREAPVNCAVFSRSEESFVCASPPSLIDRQTLKILFVLLQY